MTWLRFLLPLILSASALALPLEFKKGDRILLYGNSFVERMQEAGEFEAIFHLVHPEKNLEFRSLAWTGDEVGYRLRPERYSAHLKKLLSAWPANVVILGGFGWTESFAGDEGLPAFEINLQNYLQEVSRRHPDARIVLMLPGDSPMPTAGDHHTSAPPALKSYREAMTRIAKEEKVSVLALAKQPIRATYQWAAQKLSGLKEYNRNHLQELAKAASQKSGYVATLVRPLNAVVYYGVRGRPNEYKAEIPRYHELVEQSDAIIHDLARHPDKKFDSYPRPALPPMPGPKKRAEIPSPDEQLKTFQTAEGYEVNLFASEKDFPALKNPVQIAFGPRGRLWVVTMPSFPHTYPGLPLADKIVILEDTDRDGKADKQTVFADGLNVPDGIVFHKNGVIVSAQPRLVYMEDSDGDGRADVKTELLRGVDVTDAHHGGMIAMDPLGHVILCDGVFHRSQFETSQGVVRGIDATTYRFDLLEGTINNEYQTLTPNPWKITFDRWGNLFHMYGDGFVQDSQVIPWTPLGIYHPFKRAISIAYGKGSGAAVLNSPNFPDDYQHGMASAVLLGRFFVSLSKFNPASGLHKASDRLDILSSKNIAFRPADLAFGFDGALYVSDFCSSIVGHAQHAMRDYRWDHEHGRIWRVVHTKKPLVKDWPNVEKANTPELLKLLSYPQDSIRELVRVRLRNQPDLIAQLDQRLPSFSNDELRLEALYLYTGTKNWRPKLLKELLKSEDFRVRAAATRLLRYYAKQIPQPFDLMLAQASDPHPRVRVEVINAVSHLQRDDVTWASILGRIDTTGYKVLETMVKDASYGTTPAKSPEVPILNIPRESQLKAWLHESKFLEVKPNGRRDLKEASIRTYVTSDKATSAILSLRHQHVQVTVNGVQLLDISTWWSSDWNLQVNLHEGINEIAINFVGGGRAQGIAPAYLFSPLGKELQNVSVPTTEEELQKVAATYAKLHQRSDNVVRLTTVPFQLSFTPKEIRLKPGQKVKILFDNPDVQIHNAVLCKPGTADKVGLLADQLTSNPKAAQVHYVPASKDVLWSTPLVEAKQKVEVELTAPAQPGRYPILCTYPGHWRVMKAELIVK